MKFTALFCVLVVAGLLFICFVKPKSVHADIEGARFPEFWSCAISMEPEVKPGKEFKTESGKPFLVRFTIQPLLFGLDDLEVIPSLDNFKPLKPVKPFKGKVKKGEKISFELNLEGFKDGIFPVGIFVPSKEYYKRMEEYISSNYRSFEKDDLFKQLAERKGVDNGYFSFFVNVKVYSLGRKQ